MIMVKVALGEAQLINIEQIVDCSIEQTDAVVKSYVLFIEFSVIFPKV